MRHATLVTLLSFSALQLVPTAGADESRASSPVAVHEMKLTELLERSEEYLGKTVRVRGVVVDVGPKADPWLDIAAAEGGSRVRIRANDKTTILPLETKGTQVIAEGVFAKVTTKRAPEPKRNEKPVAEGEPAVAEVVVPPPPPVDEFQILVTRTGINKI